MKRTYRSAMSATLAILLSTSALSANAQTTSESGSNSNANSGSQSQAASMSNPTNINAPVNHQGNLTSTSSSGSNSSSGSISGSASDQQQGQSMGQSMGANNAQGQTATNTQGQEANNTQGQSANNSQGQEANNSQNQSQTQGQMANNQQGVNITYNTTAPKVQKVYTNNAVPLVATSSFSSDYCGGTVSGGASAAPIGISIGGSAPVFDKSCQSLRRAEKFGMAAVNASNMGQVQLAGRLMSMMIWSICTSDSGGPKTSKETAQACLSADLLGNTASFQPEPSAAADPAIRTPSGYPTPEAVIRQTPVASADTKVEMAQR